jgi:hypothetical protein
MYSDPDLKSHLLNSSTIKNNALIIAEWNLNYADNIKQIGNYRHRPLEDSSPFYNPYPSFDATDASKAYTGATDADIVVDGGVDSDGVPITFKSIKEKNNLLYSLEDCFGRFRPRSGINKFVYFNDKTLIPNPNNRMHLRPRYYTADKDDKFKYWTSFRTEDGMERGISKAGDSGPFIDDTAPFIVYKDKVPANRIVVKMQTQVGSVDLSSNFGYPDPFYGSQNASTPSSWKIQKLTSNNIWEDLLDYGNMPTDIASDGYLELAYGLIVPNEYKDIFVYAGEYSSRLALPTASVNGYAYLIKTNESDKGTFAIWIDDLLDYALFDAEYGWYENGQEIRSKTQYVTDLTSPDSFDSATSSEPTSYREFDYLYGLRLVVKIMKKEDATFDLIELSPRLSVDLSDKTSRYSIEKTASDLGVTGMPVGQLIASTGSIDLFDYDQAFSENNSASLISKFSNKNLQFKFYEVMSEVLAADGNIYDYYVPVKTMYSEGFPVIDATKRSVEITLRDFYLYLESTTAPQIFLTDVSLTYAISVLLDSVGISNYKFYRVQNEKDPIIPYFFISPDTSVAEVLNSLAVSTQTAMFFDELNNFVLMTKNYIMPTANERETDVTISDSTNIISVSQTTNHVYNDGKINYTTRYIQREFPQIQQATKLANEYTWMYKPVELWEIAPSDNITPINEEPVSQSSAYALAAYSLSTTLNAEPPTVVNGLVTNNVIDFGESILASSIGRYSGYFYANGEIIKYDAVEFSVSGLGNVWVSDIQEYKDYFAKLTRNGKIFPTGRVRIYAEPAYNTDGSMKSGDVVKHGRSQFGTPITSHPAGISSEWTNGSRFNGCEMDYSKLINGGTFTTISGKAGLGKLEKAKQTTVGGIVKTYLSSTNIPESVVNSLKTTKNNPGSIQSSALVMNGPSFTTVEKPADLVSYVYKPLANRFVHFGTRMRIIGKTSATSDVTQSPTGSMPYFDQVGGSSGGMAILLNPETNNGYYFEIAALTDTKLATTDSSSNLKNVFFYKVQKQNGAADIAKAIPITLWSGLTAISVDDGNFVGQSRVYAEEVPTVYDLSVEYVNNAKSRTFYLYINGKIVAVVEDTDPIVDVNSNNMALFIRGSSRVMFENLYALTTNYGQNASSLIDAPIASKAFLDRNITTTDSFNKYSLSGAIQQTYLSGISSATTPEYNIYYEEFGTIMREASYFNVRFDGKAYPALIAKMAPVQNYLKGYTVSGFTSSPYGAEFLVFNNTDTTLVLDDSSGNYLRIHGIAFTQQSQNELTVDQYFNKKSDFSSLKFNGNVMSQAKKEFDDIKNSRITYGKKDFTLDVPFIQNSDSANDMMDWMIKKVMKPRKSIGIEMFPMPTLQLGDIVDLDYVKNDVNELSESRFVVYSIEYKRQESGPSMTVYLSEVV